MNNDYRDKIAIIGMAGSFPGALDIEEFWKNLCDGVESISFFTKQQSLESGANPLIVNNPNYVGARGILKDADMFDASFFGFSPKEAMITDPQHRLFLEYSWKALENAGYCPQNCDCSIAVYAGASINSYLLNNLIKSPEFAKGGGLFTLLGNDSGFMATRVSYKLDLKGPSLSLNTGCSTSLAAVHLACRSLIDFQCDIAIAGGVSLYFPQKQGYVYEPEGILSPDGHCRSFDAEGNGTVDGNGVGAVVLKRLDEAVEDRDYIYAVIIGSAMNNDGSLKAGFTAPSEQGQVEVIHEALTFADINPDTVTFIETHGTGTTLGDPIEVRALNRVFKAKTDKEKFCAIGSVKANIGHLDAGAGVAGLIKAAMSVKNGKIAPSINFKKPNPRIDFENSPFFVNTKLIPWETKESPRRAGVSSFGIGGTNVHVILEQAPIRQETIKNADFYLLVLSAKTESALDRACLNLADYLKKYMQTDIADIAYTLQVGRKHFDCRKFVICKDIKDAIEKLEEKNHLKEKNEIQDSLDIKKLISIGEKWLKGEQIDWEELYNGNIPARIPLPSYPFEKKSYIIKNTNQPQKQEEPDIDLKDITRWFHIPSWKKTITLPYKKIDTKHCWLIFADTKGASATIAEKLLQEEQTVIKAEIGDKFEKISEYRYTLCPSKQEDYDLLAKNLKESGLIPDKIAHLWTLEEDSDTDRHKLFDQDDIEQSLNRGFYSLFFLVKALYNSSMLNNLDINAITTQLHHLAAEKINSPQNAAILGPLRVIPLEYPDVRCRNIDIELSKLEKSEIQNTAAMLITEMKNRPKEPIALYRDGQRWIQAFERTQLDPQMGISRIKDNGVYIITGGLGSMGQAFAKHLAKQAKVKIVLTGRSILPSRELWENIISDNKEQKGLFDFIQMQETEIEQKLSIKTIDMRPGLEKELNNLCSRLICDYFSESGIIIDKGKTYKIKDLYETLAIEPIFERFFIFFIKTLTKDDLISIKDDKAEFLAALKDLETADVIRKRVNSDHPGFEAIMKLLTHCTGHYREALSGKIEAISVLYPDGSSNLLEETVKNTVEYVNRKVYIRLLKYIIILIAKKSKGKKLKILEIGAGNGEMTWEIVKDLAGLDIEYYFTDIGKMFTIKAEKKAVNLGLNFMKFGVLDISEDPENQGYQKSDFDLIIGIDVAHVTKNTASTIFNLKTLLNRQGVMFLIETVKKRRWTDMIWGLAEAWWYFEDTELRKDSPLLNIDQWEQVFEEQKFKSVTIYPTDKEKREKTDFALIIAERNENAEYSYIDTIKEDQKQNLKNKITDLKKIEQLGAEVLYIKADVSSKKDMQTAISLAIEKFGKIDGVIHTAGVFGQGIMQMKEAYQAKKVLSPKIAGTIMLSNVLSDIKLDFFVLCSSMASVVPIAGQIDYCAANAFLDAFACYNTYKNKVLTISIDWGFWQELGMIKHSTISDDLKKEMENYIKEKGLSDTGVKIFDLILSCCTLPQIIVSAENIEKSLKFLNYVFLQKNDTQKIHDKIDQRSDDIKTVYKVPVTESEKIIADIWKEVLGIDQIGIDDDFFEIGGDSLLGIQIVSRINSALKTAIYVSSIIENPYISKLADYIDKIKEKGVLETSLPSSSSIKRLPDQDHYRLSHAQKGLWVISQSKEGAMAYNMAMPLLIESEIQRPIIKEAVSQIIKRHESLRTKFITADGEPRQKIEDTSMPFDISFDDLTDAADKEAEARKILKQNTSMPFDLEKAPLFRINVITFAKKRHLIIFSMHHIISDGLSLNVILKEFLANYQSLIDTKEPAKLDSLPFQYRDYAEWQIKEIKSKRSEGHRKYWQEKLSPPLHPFDIKTDYIRPAVNTYKGGAVVSELSLQNLEKLKKISRKYGVSLFIILLAGVKTLLHHYTGNEDITVCSPASCREGVDLENQIGLYLNTLPLRDTVKGAMTFEELLISIKHTVNKAFEHQFYPFDMIVSDLNLKNDPSVPQVFDVMVNLMLKNELFTTEKGALKVSLITGSPSYSLFALDFLFEESKDRLSFFIRYKTDLFKRETVLKIAKDYKIMFDKILSDQTTLQKPLKELFADPAAIKEKEQFLASAMKITEDF